MLFLHTNRWSRWSGLLMNPPGWEQVDKGVDSHENHMAQEGALGELDCWHLRWNLSGYTQIVAGICFLCPAANKLLSFLSVVSNFIKFYFAYFIGILKCIYFRKNWNFYSSLHTLCFSDNYYYEFLFLKLNNMKIRKWNKMRWKYN
jgi:hypothetical protein